ncbi:MAG: TfoX/Sxy family protein [Nocardioidaceae bacterium]
MKIPKPTEADRDRFASLVPAAEDVEVKPMFGNLGAFVRGNMFMGLFGADVGLKLPTADCERLLGEPGAGPFGPAERPMGGYVTLPPKWSASTARAWIATAYITAAALPPKKVKQRGAKRKPA